MATQGKNRSILAIVAGAVGVLLGAALIWGAATVLSGQGDGFSTTSTHPLDGSSQLVVSHDLDLFVNEPDGLAARVADPSELRIRALSASGGSLFIGIAPTENVKRFLTVVAHDEVTGVAYRGGEIAGFEYESHDGLGGFQTPLKQDYFVSWTQGNRNQTLDWSREPGEWSVVMAAGRNDAVEAIAVGAGYSDLATPAWIAAAIGIAMAAGGAFLVYLGMRRKPAAVGPTEAPAIEEEREKVPAGLH